MYEKPKARTKSFKAIDGTEIVVEVFIARVIVYTGELQGYRALYSMYDFIRIPELHSNIISEEVLNEMYEFIKIDTRPKPIEKKNEGEQFSLF